MRPRPNTPSRLTLVRTALLVLAASTVLVLSTGWDARSDGCKPDGQKVRDECELLQPQLHEAHPASGKSKATLRDMRDHDDYHNLHDYHHDGLHAELRLLQRLRRRRLRRELRDMHITDDMHRSSTRGAEVLR